MIRAFIAIPLPDEIIVTLAEIVKDLKSCLPKVSWVKPDNIHLTIKFLGNISEEKVLKIRQIMEKSCLGIAPFFLFGSGLSVFPNIKRARVIWVGVKGDVSLLKTIHYTLDEGLKSLGFVKEDRSFTPHLTLGRIKKIINERVLIDVIKKYKNFSTSSFKVKEIVLFKSELHPKGAVYTPLERIYFKE